MSTVSSAPAPHATDFAQQKKRAKDLLRAYRAGDETARARIQRHHGQKPTIVLADAQLTVAREAGYASWTALKRTLGTEPGAPGLPSLHAAAARGNLASVRRLLASGADPNARDALDAATALHFAAGNGYLAVAEALLDAGADPNAGGDDHDLGPLGWATCFRAYREPVAQRLLERGARHHVFSAVAMNDLDWVRGAVAADSRVLARPMSRNEHHRLPLHLAVIRNRPTMVALLLELGADPQARDSTGATAMSCVNVRTAPEVVASLRAAGLEPDLIAALRMRRFDLAQALLERDPARAGEYGADALALHLATFDRDVDGVRWLLEHGVDPNAKRLLWGCNHTALHVCAEHGFVDVAQVLLGAGADPSIRDDKYGSDVLGWAEFCRRPEIAALVAGVQR
jgi:ankyrin repeat protein